MDASSGRSLQIEWINVTYRSVIGALAILVLMAGAVGTGWYYFSILSPRSAADQAISRAERKLHTASELPRQPQGDKVLDGARLALAEAHEAFDAASYDQARVAAIRSENLALKAVELLGGRESQSRLVRFYRLEGDVRVKRAGEFSWESAKSNMVLNVGDQVKTSSSASAQLIYFDGTVSTIRPGSLLEIRELYENPVTKVRHVREKLNWGELLASTQKRNVDGSYHEVATENVSARAVENGEFRVAYDREKRTAHFDVFQGNIEVASTRARTQVAAGERLRSGAQGAFSSKETLPGVPRLITPRDQRVYIFDKPESDSINLNWEAVDGADRYRLVISDKPLFTGPLYDAERKGTRAVLDAVGEGAYHWKVAAISRNGSAGSFSAPRRFRVSSQQIRDRADKDPPALEISEFVPIGPMVIVNGRTEPGATLWVDDGKIDVFDDGTFYAVIRLRKEGLNELRFVSQDTAGNETELRRSAFVEIF